MGGGGAPERTTCVRRFRGLERLTRDSGNFFNFRDAEQHYFSIVL